MSGGRNSYLAGSDGRGASSVLGVVLLVGIAVVVAVPVVTAGLMIAEEFGTSPPAAQFQTTDSRTGVGFVHVGGNQVDTDNLYVKTEREQIPVSNLTDKDVLTAGTQFAVQPRGASSLSLVWRNEGTTTVLDTVESYTSTAVFDSTGSPQSLDVSNTETVGIEVVGPGGQSGGYTNTSRGITDGGASNGGFVNGTVDVSEIDELDIYVGESPEATVANPTGGWGWRDGGAPYQGSNFVGGGGGGASAVVADGRSILVAHGGGGGTDWDTFTFYAGGGGGGGGTGGPLWFNDKAEDGEGTGLGGDGAGGTTGGDEDSFVPATPGGAEIAAPSLVTDGVRKTGGGESPDTDGVVRITYTVGDEE